MLAGAESCDPVPFDFDGSGRIGVEVQLAALQRLDLSGQPVTVAEDQYVSFRCGEHRWRLYGKGGEQRGRSQSAGSHN